MNSGIFKKSWRECRTVTITCALAFLGFQIVLARVFASMGDQFIEQLMNMGFARTVMQALLGTQISSASPEIFRAFGWVHPVILALAWVHAITCCTRLPVGEVEAGTADFLLTLPLSRRVVFVSTSVSFITSAAVVMGCGLIGVWLGHQSLPDSGPFNYGANLMITLNYLAVYLAVSGLSAFNACVCSRRGQAIGITLSLVLSSFFWTFVSQFWGPAKATPWLSLLHYYQPMEILRNHQIPGSDLAVLSLFALVGWVGAWLVFRSKHINTN